MDKIVSVVSYRDYVLVFTERGTIYKVVHNDTTGVTISTIYTGLGNR